MILGMTCCTQARPGLTCPVRCFFSASLNIFPFRHQFLHLTCHFGGLSATHVSMAESLRNLLKMSSCLAVQAKTSIGVVMTCTLNSPFCTFS